MARTDIAPALIELGIDAVSAEEIERQIRENGLLDAGLDGVHWWAMQRWAFDPVEAVREARLGWWLSPAIATAYKRLLDARYEDEPGEDGVELVRKPVVTWDAAAERFVEDAKSLLPIWQGTLKRAWAEAWRAWPGFAVQPDIPPTLPDFSSLKSLTDYYVRVRPREIDPGHPAHVLRIFLEAIESVKAWDESQVNRHPAGTPVDAATGAGGGRFAPKPDAPQRVWQGKQQPAAENVPSKLDVGALGERMVASIFSHLMETPFRTLNEGRSNAPLDLFGDHMAVEVKAGLASNQSGAQKWRSTIGEPGKAEKALLAQMQAEEKRRHNAWKRAEILRRKQEFAEQLSKRTPDGQSVTPVTIGLIFSPDLSMVDLYVIDGYHSEMRWSQYANEDHLLATYKVDEWLN